MPTGLIIQIIITLLISLGLRLIPVVGSVMYFKTCKEPHAHMLLWGSVATLLPPIFNDLYKYFVLQRMEDLSVLQVELPAWIIYSIGLFAYLAFGIGFILLIKKITKTQPAA